MNDFLISIIIPTYNRAHIIGETLDSIIEQTYTNWECIVVDDGSTDNTNEVLADYCKNDVRFQYYKRPQSKKKGPCSCRNFGFEKSKGTFINFLDSDDFYKPITLEKIISYDKNNYDVIVTKIDFIDFKTKAILKQNSINSSKILEDFFVEKINFYVCGPFWKRKYLEKQESLFDEEIGIGDDWDFNFRMLWNKPSLCLVEETLVVVRVHNNSFSKQKNKLNKEEWLSEFQALNKNFLKIINNNEIDKYKIKKYILFRYNKPLKWALIKNKNIKYFFLKKKLLKQFEFNSYKGFFKTLFGFITYSIFKKGYRLINDKLD